MDFDDLNNLKLPHSMKCACGERARYIGEDRGVSAKKIALCEECYEAVKVSNVYIPKDNPVKEFWHEIWVKHEKEIEEEAKNLPKGRFPMAPHVRMGDKLKGFTYAEPMPKLLKYFLMYSDLSFATAKIFDLGNGELDPDKGSRFPTFPVTLRLMLLEKMYEKLCFEAKPIEGYCFNKEPKVLNDSWLDNLRESPEK